MAIQLTKEQETELLSMTRVVTPADEAELNRAYAELEKKGFVMNGENFMVLLRAYNQAPQVPISVQNVLQFATKYRDSFQWLSADEVEFRKLSDQLGTTTTDLVIRLLGRHGLVNTQGSEDMFHNFNQVVGFYQTRGWKISADSFERAIGNLRASLGHGTLIYKPTPSELARQKRWDDTRTSEPPKKSALEIAKAKAAAMSHVVNPDGRRMSDVIMEEFFKAYPEAAAPEASTQQTPPVNQADAYWEKQTKDFIQSISSNLLRTEAEQLYGHKQHDSWRATYRALEIWHDRKKYSTDGSRWAR